MKYSFTDEQTTFRSVIRRFLENTSTPKDTRRLMAEDTGFDQKMWHRISQELGLTGLHIPEEYGGQGFGVSELSIATEEMGRALLVSPYFASTVLAATAILKAASEPQKQALLPAIASGETIATLAVTEDHGSWDLKDITATATPGPEPRLNGHKSFVLDGTLASEIIVAARAGETPDSLALFRVRADAPGLSRSALTALDPTRKIARLEMVDVPAERLDGPVSGRQALEETLDIAAICLAGEMVGGAERLLESALSYANMRVQFGRPIASFQSLKHKAADMLLEVELAKSGAYYAAAAADENDPETPALASLAKVAAAEAYMQTAIHTIQIHGGLGFTWDNDTHLWFKRAKSSEVFLGASPWHRERLMQKWDV